jgi:hypothetical protein
MTYQDPKLPDPGLGQNPPRYRDLDTDSYYTGSIIALILGIVLIGGVILYGVSDLGVSDLSIVNNTPPTTTGQGGAQMTQRRPPRFLPSTKMCRRKKLHPQFLPSRALTTNALANELTVPRFGGVLFCRSRRPQRKRFSDPTALTS